MEESEQDRRSSFRIDSLGYTMVEIEPSRTFRQRIAYLMLDSRTDKISDYEKHVQVITA